MKLPTEIVVTGMIMVPPPATYYRDQTRISQEGNLNPWARWRFVCLWLLILVVYPTAARGAVNVVVNQKVTRRLTSRGSNWYRILLTKRAYVRVLVNQTSIDVQIELFDPSGRELSETDGFEYGIESASFFAKHSGIYSIEVRSAQTHSPPGDYILQVVKLENGAAEYEQRVAAERISTEAKHLASLGTPVALQRGLDKSKGALALWRNLHDKGAVLGTLIRMGEICYSMRSSEAPHYFSEALPLSRAVGDARSEGEIYNDIGMTKWQDDEPESALSHLKKALMLWKSIDYRYGEAAALSNEGILLTQMGEYQEALNNYFRALGLIEPLKDLKGEAFITNNIGAAYRRLGEYGESAGYLTRAIGIFRLDNNMVAAARATLTLSRVNIDLGLMEEAIHRAKAALSVLEAAKDRQWGADAWCVLGNVYERRGQPEKALECDTRSFAESQSIRYLRGEANALYGIGVVRYAKSNLASAQRALLEALRIEQQLDLPDSEAATQYSLAKVESKRGNLRQASLWAKSAIKTTESLRANVPGDEFRTSFLATKLGPYSLDIDILMRLHAQQPTAGFAKKAFETSEQERARSLVDMLREGHEHVRKGVPADLLSRERTVERSLDFESTRLLEATDSHNQALQQRIRKRRELLLENYQEVEARIRAESPSYAAITQPIALTLGQIQREVLSDDDTVLLEYELGTKRSYGWAVTRQAIFSWTIPRRSVVEKFGKRMDALIRQPYITSNDQKRLDRAKRALGRMLISPVISEIQHKRLLVVGDGILQTIPFGALPITSKSGKAARIPLVAEHEIVMLPSASTLAVLRHELDGRRPARRKLAVLADPVFDRLDERVQNPRLAAKTGPGPDVGSEYRRLLFSREEAGDISTLALRSKRMEALDFAASKQTVLSGKLAEYQIVHISTHGILNQVHPELSALVFSLVNQHGAPEDGFLRLYDIYNLKLSADLVVLSACDTFLGGNIRGEGLVGLARGFMYAGAKSVVASLWSVDDESTAVLMKRFYENMLGRKRMRPAAALRAAQVSMWREGRWKPYNWAGFVIEGEW